MGDKVMDIDDDMNYTEYAFLLINDESIDDDLKDYIMEALDECLGRLIDE